MSSRSVRVPTGMDDLRLVARTVRLIMTTPTYALLAATSTLLGLSLFVLSQNVQLVQNVILGGTLPLDARLAVLFALYPVVGTAFTPLTESFLLATALLFGINTAMLVYHLREHGLELREGGGSVAGVILGTIGAGCAACGSAILAGALSLFGVTGVLTQLPLDGLEFSLLAFGVLSLSVYWLADGMRGGEIDGCPVDVRH